MTSLTNTMTICAAAAPLDDVTAVEQENLHLIERFVNAHKANCRPDTAEKYRGFLRELADYHGDRSLTELTDEDLAAFVVYLRDERPSKKRYRTPRPVKKGVEASTLKAYVAAVKLFYRRLRRWKLIVDDPAEELKAPRQPIKRQRKLSKQELRRLLDATGSDRCTIQAYLLAFTLGRSDSIAHLRWRDVDFEHERIYFDRAKGDRFYWVPVHPELLSALRFWKHEQQRQAKKNPAMAKALSDPETAWVLLTKNGQRVCKQTIAKQLDWRAARAEVRLLAKLVAQADPDEADAEREPGTCVHKLEERKTEVSPRVIRRSMATLLRKDGVSVFDVQPMLNHKSVGTTLAFYATDDDEAKDRAIGGIAI